MRYLRLYAHFIRFSFSKAFQFRIDFYFRILMDLLFYIISILFFKILFLHSKFIGNWNEQQVTVFACAYLVMDAVYMTMFANNLWWLPYNVNKGDLDYYLVRPASSLFFLTLREFAANSFLNLIMAVALFAWSLTQYQEPIIVWQLVLYVILLFNGTYLYSIFHLFAILPVFWTKSPRGFSDIYWKAAHLGERPDHIYKGWLKKILLSVFPMSIIVSYPTRLFLEDFDWTVLLNIFLVTLLSTFLLIILWKKALKNYTSASS